jgi:hypothetical protein
MSAFLQSPLGFYVSTAILNILLTVAFHFIQRAKQKAEQEVSSLFPVGEAQKINHLLDVVERLTESAVYNANNQIVNSLKQHNLFTTETAASLKQAVTQEIINNMGPFKEKTGNLLGSWESVIGNMIEKHVILAKTQGKQAQNSNQNTTL